MYRPSEYIYYIDRFCFNCKKPLEKDKPWFFAYDHCFCSKNCRNIS